MTLPIDNGVIDKMINNFIEAMHGKCPQKHFKIKVKEFKERSMHLVLKNRHFLNMKKRNFLKIFMCCPNSFIIFTATSPNILKLAIIRT